jgi:riboflavin synthase alpha subunit
MTGLLLEASPSKLEFKREEKMTDEKILTKHSLGKSGKIFDKQKYETLKKAILSALKTKELTHTELSNRLNKSLKGKFSGNISWYGETVKLDLEARKMIERTSSKPQKYRLKLK